MPHLLSKLGSALIVSPRLRSLRKNRLSKGYPMESALVGDDGQGWHAAPPGTQVIRIILISDEPQTLRRIWLVCEDAERPARRFVPTMVAGCWPLFSRNRTPTVEVQPFRFNPEIEDYTVALLEAAINDLEFCFDWATPHSMFRTVLEEVCPNY
jgi:hypothetical protein